MSNFKYIATAAATSGNVATFDFTSIPQTYQDLVLFVSARNNTNNYGGYFMIFNGTTMSSNVDAIRLGFTGASVLNSTSKEAVWNLSSDTGGVEHRAGARIYIPNYTSTTSNKQAFISASQGGTKSDQVHHLSSWNWGQTNAVTRIELRTDSGVDIFKQYSYAVLYGISK